jgi:hypothetical protein
MARTIAVALLAICDAAVVPRAEPLAVTVTRSTARCVSWSCSRELIRTIVARLEGGGFQLQPNRPESMARPDCGAHHRAARGGYVTTGGHD